MSQSNPSYETTLEGDVVVVQPSFDDTSDRPKTPTPPSTQKTNDWQDRSPKQDDTKPEDEEPRNPASPTNTKKDLRISPRHTRNLSAHFFDATTLNEKDDQVTKNLDASEVASNTLTGRKHRRMFSGGASNPSLAHRRVNSIGNSTSIKRDGPRLQTHNRENSAGLDILSAAVEAAPADELTQAAGVESAPSRSSSTPWEPPRPPQSSKTVHPTHNGPIGHVSTGSPYEAKSYAPPVPPSVHSSMNPPAYPHQGAISSRSNHYPHHPQYHASPYPGHSQYHSYSPHTPYYQPGYPPRTSPPPGYPVQYSQRPMETYPTKRSHHAGSPQRVLQRRHSSEGLTESEHKIFDGRTVSTPQVPHSNPGASATHQGSQTFVTAIAVGQGNKAMHVSDSLRNAPASTENNPSISVPSQVGHHRKMSSFSTLGTMFGSSILSGADNATHRPTESAVSFATHRPTESAVSFLQGIDEALNDDDVFLQNLQASNSGPGNPPVPSDSQRPTTLPLPPRGEAPTFGTKLASGGTSKRVRRKCSIASCPNRVVQGGLCIAHGAKRKTCKYPGCTKNVKKAGLCSTHGPARKRCDFEGCQKVAVQGGRCIAHGAKKKLCSIENCKKQAILSGMCKKHHDQYGASARGSSLHNRSLSSAVQKPKHARGLSIFHEMSADGVQCILDGEQDIGSDQW